MDGVSILLMVVAWRRHRTAVDLVVVTAVQQFQRVDGATSVDECIFPGAVGNS